VAGADPTKPTSLEREIDLAARGPELAPLLCAAKSYLRHQRKLEPLERAQRLRYVSLALQEQARRYGTPLAARHALGRARQAVSLLDTAWFPLDRAGVLDTAANAYYLLGTMGMQPRLLARALTLFDQALALVDHRLEPQAWCVVANSMASVLATRHRTDGGLEHMVAATAVYRRVRSVAARSGLRSTWVDAASNILRMERDAADGAGDPDRLDRLTHRMRRVLGAITNDIDLATRSNVRLLLAITLCKIADHRYGRPRLEEARKLLAVNVKEWRQAGSDLEMAKSANSIALIDMTIGEKEEDLGAYRRAARQLARIAEFPSLRPKTRLGRTWPWTPEKAPEFYSYALFNIVAVRESIPRLSNTAAPIHQNIQDLNDYLLRHTPTDRSLAAQLIYLRASSAIVLASVTHDRRLRDEAERFSLQAADAFAAIGQQATAAVSLNKIGALLQEEARGSDAVETLGQAEAHHRRAVSLAGPDETSDFHLSAWSLHTFVRLRLASWQRDLMAAQSILEEVAAKRLRLSDTLSPTRALFIDWLAVNAQSVFARIGDSPSEYRKLLGVTQSFRERHPTLPQPIDIPLTVAQGHAQRALGERNQAIETWTRAQTLLWTFIIETGGPDAAHIATCGLGEASRNLLAGRGLSLADELAMAFIERGQADDLVHALTAIERGRAVAAALEQSSSAEAYTLRNTLRNLEKRHAERMSESSQRPGDSALKAGGRMSWRRDHIRQRLAALFAGSGGVVNIDPRAVTAALPVNAAVIVIVLAERRAAVIAIGAGIVGQTHTASHILDLLDRHSIDGLLLGSPSGAGFLDTIGNLQALPADSPSSDFLTVVERFSAAFADMEQTLQPRLLDPCCDLMHRQFKVVPYRTTWLLPGIMWPLPLHAMRSSQGLPLAEVQGFGRSLRELSALAARSKEKRFLPRETLVIDDPCDDIQAPTPFPDMALPPSTFKVTKLAGGKATAAAILRALRRAEVVLFNGHGIVLSGARDESGLVVAGQTHRTELGSHPHGVGRDLLRIEAIRQLNLGVRDVAVLAACDVGSIDLEVGVDDFSGLPAELIAAGFSSVVSATWPVEAMATSLTIQHFLKSLRFNPLDPASALAAAQAEIRSATRTDSQLQTQLVGSSRQSAESAAQVGSTGMSAVYWWAGFRVIGF